MNFQSNNKFVYRNFLSVLLLLFVNYIGNAQEITLTAISNNKGAPSSLKMSELKSILKGEQQRWKDGTKVSIVLMKTSTPVGEITCKKIYNMSSDKVKRFWLGLSFSGRAEAPVFCNSQEELESLVAQNPGSIGIIDKSSGMASIKTISIDGKSFF